MGFKWSRESADDLQVAQFLGADVHQEVFALCIIAIQSLDGILHRRRQLAVRATKLLEQHVAELRIGLVDAHGVHQFFYMVVH